MSTTLELVHGDKAREFRSLDLRLTSDDPRTIRRLALDGGLFEVGGPEEGIQSHHASLVTEAAIRQFGLKIPGLTDTGGHDDFDDALAELRRISAVLDGRGRLRVAHQDISIGFAPDTTDDRRMRILQRFSLERTEVSPWRPTRWIARNPSGEIFGERLYELSNELATIDEVIFATPRFASEYRREVVPTSYSTDQWYFAAIHLAEAWTITKGVPEVVIACLDDGVQLSHSNLLGQIKLDPDPAEPKDQHGRDFFVKESQKGHFNPRPKVFQIPYYDKSYNDIHGTPCAGLLVANGAKAGVTGAAPGCLLLPVKIFHGGANIADDARVAAAISYASNFAHVISCSWTGVWDADIESAIADAGLKNGGKGVAVFCATGNYGPKIMINGVETEVDYPAAYQDTIAVGACTHTEKHASYSNEGPEVDLVAPSSGDYKGILALDISEAGKGYNEGLASLGGADGDFYIGFGGTSAATPIAAAVGALCLSVDNSLTRSELKELLIMTAEKIDTGYDATGHSEKLGYGRVNASAAVSQALARTR